MQGKLNKKTLIAIVIVAILAIVGITGTVVFLKGQETSSAFEADAQREEIPAQSPNAGTNLGSVTRDPEASDNEQNSSITPEVTPSNEQGNNAQEGTPANTDGNNAGNTNQGANNNQGNTQNNAQTNNGTTNNNTNRPNNNNNNTGVDQIQETVITRVVEGDDIKVAEDTNMKWSKLEVTATTTTFNISTDSKFEETPKKSVESDSDSNEFVVPGEVFTYKITIKAKEDMKNVEVKDILPIEVEPADDTVNAGKITVDGKERDVVKLAVDLKAGEETVVSFKVKVKEDVKPNTVIKNTAIVNGETTTTTDTEVKELTGIVRYFDIETNEEINAATQLKDITLGEEVFAKDYEIDIEGYTFEKAEPESIAVRADSEKNELDLYYKTSRYTVTARVEGGNGEVAPATQTVEYGEDAEVITITPAAGYEIASITDNGTTVTATNSTYTVTNVTENHEVVVAFTKIEYTVTARVEGGNGEVAPATQTVEYGEDAKVITITPEEGYEIASITDNGITVTATNSTYTVTNVTENHEVVVTFRKVGSLQISIDSDYPKNGVQAEPGNTVKLTLTLNEKNESEKVTYPTTVTVKLNVTDREGNPVTNPITAVEGASYDPATGTVTFAVNSKDDLTKEINVTVGNNVPAGSKLTQSDVTGAELIKDSITPIEQTVRIEKQIDKNIVMVLDVSGSMNFCNIHGEDHVLCTDSWNNPAGTMYGCYGCGAEHITSNRVQTGTDWRGNPRYETVYSCTEHGTENIKSIDVEDGWNYKTVYYCDTCARAYTSRLKSLKIAAKAFTESILNNKGENENISITLITFASNVSTRTTVKNPSVSSIQTAIDNMTANGGTNMRQSIVAAKNVFDGNSVYKGNNVKNILVFLSDGEPNAGAELVGSRAVTNLNNVPNLEKFAIGLGNSFDRTQLDALTDNVYTATDTETLVNEFNKIADKINSLQTSNGNFGDTLTDAENIYPVVLSYKDATGNTVNITANNVTELAANHVEISTDKKITWDISGYPGCKDFVIKIGIKAAGENTNGERKARARRANNVEEITWTVVYQGDPTIVDAVKHVNVSEPTSISNVLSTITEKVVNNEITEKNVEEVKAKVEEIDTAKNQPNEEPVETTKPEEKTEPTTTPEPTEEVKEPEVTGEEAKKPTETPTTSEEVKETDANVTNSTEKPEEGSKVNNNTVENNTITEVDNTEPEITENNID